LTTDHTMASMGVVGVRASHLATALGVEACPKLDVLQATPRANDVYLMCSDGLPKMVADEPLAETLRAAASATEAARRLVDMANAAGGHDNVTAIVIRVTGSRLPGGSRHGHGARNDDRTGVPARADPRRGRDEHRRPGPPRRKESARRDPRAADGCL